MEGVFFFFRLTLKPASYRANTQVITKSVLFIGTQCSNLYTSVDTPAKGRVVGIYMRGYFKKKSVHVFILHGYSSFSSVRCSQSNFGSCKYIRVSLYHPPVLPLYVAWAVLIISENSFDGVIRSVSRCFVYATVCKWRTGKREKRVCVRVCLWRAPALWRTSSVGRVTALSLLFAQDPFALILVVAAQRVKETTSMRQQRDEAGQPRYMTPRVGQTHLPGY